MQIYWINLDRRSDRRAFMERQFSEFGLSAERVSAVEPASLDRFLPQSALRTLAARELCVTASHRVVWMRMLERGISHALVLEDDARLSRLLPQFLDEAEQPAQVFDIVRIETGHRRVRTGPATERLPCGVVLRRAYSDQWGTAGYIISARGAAQVVDHSGLYDMPLDHFLFNPRGPGFALLDWRQCEPGLCIQADRLDAGHPMADSDVTSERRRGMKKSRAKSLGTKAAREGARLGRQAAALARDVHDLVTRGIFWRRIRYLP